MFRWKPGGERGVTHRNSATHEVGRRCHRDGVLGDVHAVRQALPCNVGEVGEDMVPLAVADVQVHVGLIAAQHLVLYGSCDHIPGSQLKPAVILGHEPAVVWAVRQDTSADIGRVGRMGSGSSAAQPRSWWGLGMPAAWGEYSSSPFILAAA